MQPIQRWKLLRNTYVALPHLHRAPNRFLNHFLLGQLCGGTSTVEVQEEGCSEARRWVTRQGELSPPLDWDLRKRRIHARRRTQSVMPHVSCHSNPNPKQKAYSQPSTSPCAWSSVHSAPSSHSQPVPEIRHEACSRVHSTASPSACQALRCAALAALYCVAIDNTTLQRLVFATVRGTPMLGSPVHICPRTAIGDARISMRNQNA